MISGDETPPVDATGAGRLWAGLSTARATVVAAPCSASAADSMVAGRAMPTLFEGHGQRSSEGTAVMMGKGTKRFGVPVLFSRRAEPASVGVRGAAPAFDSMKRT